MITMFLQFPYITGKLLLLTVFTPNLKIGLVKNSSLFQHCIDDGKQFPGKGNNDFFRIFFLLDSPVPGRKIRICSAVLNGFISTPISAIIAQEAMVLIP